MTLRDLIPVLASLDPTSGTDLKSIILFAFVLCVLCGLGWLVWTKAPSPLNWILMFILAAVLAILGYRFIQSI